MHFHRIWPPGWPQDRTAYQDDDVLKPDRTEIRRRYKVLTQHEVNQAVYRLTPAGTQEIADLVGVARQSAASRLRRLEEDGIIWSKKVGPTMVWLHPWIMNEPGWEPTRWGERRFGRSFGTSPNVYSI